jgi:SpoVK/Ycf46/Vps4 family AAA+-type ATPase
MFSFTFIKILAKEDLEPNFDFEALAKMTEGFSGSDIKNLCIAGAYQPIREILQKEVHFECCFIQILMVSCKGARKERERKQSSRRNSRS